MAARDIAEPWDNPSRINQSQWKVEILIRVPRPFWIPRYPLEKCGILDPESKLKKVGTPGPGYFSEYMFWGYRS